MYQPLIFQVKWEAVTQRWVFTYKPPVSPFEQQNSPRWNKSFIIHDSLSTLSVDSTDRMLRCIYELHLKSFLFLIKNSTSDSSWQYDRTWCYVLAAILNMSQIVLCMISVFECISCGVGIIIQQIQMWHMVGTTAWTAQCWHRLRCHVMLLCSQTSAWRFDPKGEVTSGSW